MKRKEMFGIGAVVLLVTVAISPAIADTNGPALIPNNIYSKLEQFNCEHETELDEINTYLKSLEKVPNATEIPKHIIYEIETLPVEMLKITGYYPVVPTWEGMTSFWRSNTTARFFPKSELYYWGWVLSLNRTLTDQLMTVVGSGVATTLLFLTTHIPVIGLWLVVLFGMILYQNWDYFVKILKDIYKTCPYGCMLWFFWSPGNFSFITWPQAQPNHTWTPWDYFSQTTWTRIF